jgi:hypothetical protein
VVGRLPTPESSAFRRRAAIGLAALLSLVPIGCAGRPGGDATVAPGEVAAATPEIRFVDDPDDPSFGIVSVRGLPPSTLERLAGEPRERADWVTLFSVHTADAIESDRPAVLGDYAVEGDAIRFRPRFSFVPAMDYRARWNGSAVDRESGAPPGTTPDLEATFRMPEPEDRAATRVEAVYPSTARVPENLLRLYIHFSAPVDPKDVQRHVHLYDASGSEVAMPFVEVEHGLWDPGYRRLTLFLHPGRIKRGVAPNLEMGPPLKEGLTYKLVVDRELRDAGGRPLAERFERDLRVGPADRESPQTDRWRVAAPGSSGEPLRLDFPEPLDRALLGRWIAVVDSAGSRVDGHVKISRSETRWEFTPDGGWSPGEHTLMVHPALEDLAGNTLTHLFDEDPAHSSFGAGADPRPEELSFRVP